MLLSVMDKMNPLLEQIGDGRLEGAWQDDAEPEFSKALAGGLIEDSLAFTPDAAHWRLTRAGRQHLGLPVKPTLIERLAGFLMTLKPV